MKVPMERMAFMTLTAEDVTYIPPNAVCASIGNRHTNVLSKRSTEASGLNHLRSSVFAVAKSATNKTIRTATRLASGIILKKSL